MTIETSRAWAEINLSNIENNLKIIKSHLSDKVKAVAVIKANGYGHGAVEVAKLAEKCGYSYLAVACIDEAIKLRKNGITLPLLLLSGVNTFLCGEYINNGVIPAVSDYNTAKELNSYGKKIKVHLKIDTVMTRLGFSSDDIETTVSEIKKISELENIEIDGIFSHFSVSDEFSQKEYTKMQYNKFQAVIKALENSGINVGLKHICNSAATIANPEMHLDMVRCGIIIYGYYPNPELENTFPGLKPALELKARISLIREIEKNISVSYGRTYTSSQKMTLAVLPIGYADGYSRALSNKFDVLVNGKRAKITGRVCMDQLMVDITGIDGVKAGDVVTLIGKDKNEMISVDDMANALHTISYEITCSFSERIPRISIYDKF